MRIKRCTMKTILLAVLAVIPVLSARGESTGQAVQELVQTIRAQIPDGWVVTYQRGRSLLEVYRRKSVLGNYPAIPNQFPDELNKSPASVRGRVSFMFRVKEGVTPAEYKRLSAENAPVHKELKNVTNQLEQRKMQCDKGGTYVPRNDSDKQLLAQYNALKLHYVPDYYFRTISLDLEGEPGGRGIGDFSPKDEQVRDECTRVREILMKLLSKYE